MTTAAAPILALETPVETPRRRRLLGGKDIWALADQVLISGSNFVTMVLAARGLHPEAFGAFTLVYSALLFANVLQSTLITQPHNVIGAARTGADYVRYTTSTAIVQLGMTLLCVLAAAGIAGSAIFLKSPATSLLVALVPVILTWQLQEFVRRVLYTEARFAAAFINDMVSYGMQMILIAALLWRDGLLTGGGVEATDAMGDAPKIMYCLAITSGAAAVLGIWQLRKSLGRQIDRAAFGENWRFGRWLAGAEILQWCSSLNVYLYIAAALFGTAASGELKAAQVLFGPARVLAFQLTNILPMKFSRTLATGGNAALHRRVKSVYAWFAPLTGSYCIIVAIFAGPLMKLMYGPDYAGHKAILSLYAACAFAQYLELVLSAAMTAKRQTQWAFISYVYSAAVAVVAAYPLLWALGVEGAVVGMILTSTVVVAVFCHAYQRNILQPAKAAQDERTRSFEPAMNDEAVCQEAAR
jgi:O-antigen/teichoic acid export membrane protein